MTMKHGMERKRKLRMPSSKNSILNLLKKNKHAHRTGRARRKDGTSKPRRVVCKFTSYKAKEAILKRARRIKPEGLTIFEDQ